MRYLNEIWAMIPARSGSKGIINKNLKIIKGKPLLTYSIIAAKKTKNISKIVFSSDSDRYYNIAKKYSEIIFHKRPKKISKDDSTDFEYFYHFVKNYKEKLPKYFVHLRPTSPFRDPKILDQVIRNFLKNAKTYSSLRSVNSISNIIFKTTLIKNNKLYSPIYNSFGLDILNNSRQSYGKAYLGNGYIDIIKTDNIFKGYLHGNNVKPFVYEKIITDIDDLKDLKKARKFKFLF